MADFFPDGIQNAQVARPTREQALFEMAMCARTLAIPAMFAPSNATSYLLLT
jgi:hypothetical protein